MIRTLFLFFWLIGCLPLWAQDHYSCDSERYRLDVFEEVIVTKDVKYSEAQTIGGDTVSLYMDIYEPTMDTVSQRPFIVLAFGGSFVTGEKEDLRELCERFAQKGYVAVSIDYRLYDLALIPLPTETEMQDVVIKAVVDMKTALQYLDSTASNGNTYGLDMDQLYVGGVSSGAITANHVAMLDPTDIFSPAIQTALDNNAPVDGITNANTGVEIKGILNYSGGLHDVSWIDSSEPPFISYHEDEDPTVPYKSGFAQIFGQNIIFLNGSFSMDSAAQANGVTTTLNTISANTHVGYFFDAEKTTEIIDESAFFMFEIICSETANVSEIEKDKPYMFGPNPSEGVITIAVRGEAKVSLYDMAGRVVMAMSIQNSENVDLADVTPGSYFLKVQIGDKVYTEKVVRK